MAPHMKELKRDIVGAYIFSADGKVLLGKSIKGCAYEGYLVIPGGGIDEGETKIEALIREIQEEVGVDISGADMKPLPESSGESKKTLRDTKETVMVKMRFFDYLVYLKSRADEVGIVVADDFGEANWYTKEDLANERLGPNTKKVLKSISFIQ